MIHIKEDHSNFQITYVKYFFPFFITRFIDKLKVFLNIHLNSMALCLPFTRPISGWSK